MIGAVTPCEMVTVESESPLEVIHGFWFALHGMFPELELVQ